MACVDYEFYTGVYLGAAIPEPDFPRLAARAGAFVGLITFGRLGGDPPESARLAVCAVAEELKKQEDAGGIVASESVGSHSVSYAVPLDTENAEGLAERRLYRAAKVYLANTGLLYRGCYREDGC